VAGHPQRGYFASEFADAFERYVPAQSPGTSGTSGTDWAGVTGVPDVPGDCAESETSSFSNSAWTVEHDRPRWPRCSRTARSWSPFWSTQAERR
jgi:hypothetical protein